MEPSFEKLLVHLADHEIDFVVVGGIAVALNGYVRLTEDVDILVGLKKKNLERLIQALASYGEGHGADLCLEDFAPTPGAVRVIEESETSQLDIFSVMQNKQYSDLASRAETTFVGGKEIKYASKHDLIELKSNSVREKDQIDVIAMKNRMNEKEQ